MVSDPTDAVYARADRRLRDQLGRMDLDALLEEHRQLPYGPHSDALARLLTYFRRAETSGKYVIYSRATPAAGASGGSITVATSPESTSTPRPSIRRALSLSRPCSRRG